MATNHHHDTLNVNWETIVLWNVVMVFCFFNLCLVLVDSLFMSNLENWTKQSHPLHSAPHVKLQRLQLVSFGTFEHLLWSLKASVLALTWWWWSKRYVMSRPIMGGLIAVGIYGFLFNRTQLLTTIKLLCLINFIWTRYLLTKVPLGPTSMLFTGHSMPGLDMTKAAESRISGKSDAHMLCWWIRWWPHGNLWPD